MATYPFLRITNGTTTITFADGTSAAPGDYTFNRRGWSPAVSVRRTDELGGQGPYEDVVETLDINVTGSTVPAAYANLNALVKLLDQAEQWAAGMPVAPVIIQWIPQGSNKATSSPYEAVILGRAVGDTSDTPVVLPSNYNEAGLTRFVLGLRLMFWRRGLWLNETDTASSVATNSSEVWSITLPAHDQESPILLSWTIPSATATDDYRFGAQLMAITSGAASSITIQNAEDYAGGVFTTQAIANARNGSVLRFTPTLANTTYGTPDIAPPALPAAGMYAVYAQANINSSSFTMQVRLVVTLNTRQQLTTPFVTIPLNTLNGPCEATLLGVLSLPDDIDSIAFIRIEARGSDPATQIGQIDSLVWIRLETETHLVTFDSSLYLASSYAQPAMEERIDHRLLTALAPIAQVGRTAGTERTAVGTQGDLILTQRGTSLRGIWLAGNAVAAGSGFGGLYRATNQASVVFQTTVTATRRRGYLIPE